MGTGEEEIDPSWWAEALAAEDGEPVYEYLGEVSLVLNRLAKEEGLL